MAARLIIDGAVVAEILRSPDGPLGLFLIERATVFQMRAKAQAPVKTGVLRASIVKRAVLAVDNSLSITIIADTTPSSPTRTSYALYVHNGTKEHQIVGNPLLAFFWPTGFNGPGMYFFHSVTHKATAGNHFFTDNISAFASA